jgi:hypothetical protein
MQKLFLTFVVVLFCIGIASAQKIQKRVDFSGNAYVTEHHEGTYISQKGLTRWTDANSVIKTFVYFSKPQTIHVQVNGRASGNSVFTVGFLDKQTTVNVSQGDFRTPMGEFQIPAAGYYALVLQGVEKSGDYFAEISSFFIQSSDTEMVYVHNFSDYWGRRGPSVHLSYTMPPDETVEWFYNEVTVPEDNDIIGSFYMANGFGEGYFGIQVNSETERRVLFSVWSPYETDDPNSIPDSLRIKMLRRGTDVHIGEFGNEGSGGQSFLRYNWKAGNTYKFLTQIHPDGKGNTIYTAYFFTPDENRWRWIACFLRPESDTYYTRAHSFLENFLTGQGHITRQVYFGDQWFRSKSGEWIEGTQARFTYDATARAGVRIDYQGGYDAEQNKFFLRNCGFFHESTPFGETFTRREENRPPNIDFEALKEL